jgi:hypothetical protein
LTLQEFANKYGYKESVLKDHFPSAQLSIFLRLGIKTIKVNGNEFYDEPLQKYLKPEYEQLRLYYMDDNAKYDFTLNNATLIVLLGLTLFPYETIKGTYEDILCYFFLEPTEKNVELLKDAILELIDYNLISIVEIEGSNDIILYVTDSAKENYKIKKETYEEFKKCLAIKKKHVHSETAYRCLKMWIGFNLLLLKEETKAASLQILVNCGDAAYKTFLQNAKIIVKENPEYANSFISELILSK